MLTLKINLNLAHWSIKLMDSITRYSSIGIPAIIGLGIAWIANRIIKNEKELKDREEELILQLNNKHC